MQNQRGVDEYVAEDPSGKGPDQKQYREHGCK
jgi:hypothetical protein